MFKLGHSIFVKRNLPHSTIVFRVSTIYIACNTATKQCVIQTGIEFSHIFICSALYLNSAQVVVPHRNSFFVSVIECGGFCFTFEVKACIFYRCIGKPYLNINATALFGVIGKVETRTNALFAARAGFYIFLNESAPCIGLHVGNGTKIHCKVGPFLILLDVGRKCSYKTFDASIFCISYLRIFNRTAFALLIANIENDIRLF